MNDEQKTLPENFGLVRPVCICGQDKLCPAKMRFEGDEWVQIWFCRNCKSIVEQPIGYGRKPLSGVHGYQDMRCISPNWEAKQLAQMTADEARHYAHTVSYHMRRMAEELNAIPGVSVNLDINIEDEDGAA